ncbi:MAG: S8 family serine peptidase [Anaerolineae bacterium]|nr:S8 family serine peptidase [Anaerolineae bacterium]
MKKFLVVLSLILIVAMVGIVPVAAEGPEGRYIILLKKNAIPADLASQVEAAGGTLVRTLPEVGIAIAVSSDPDFTSEIGGLKTVSMVGVVPAFALPDVIVEPNMPTDADVYFNAGYVWGVERVNAPAAWEAGYTGSHDTVVAILDTGVAWNHPDLAPNVIAAKCFDSTGGPCNPYPSVDEHGTHVAGTVAAAFGGAGVIGVGPNLGIASYNIFEYIPDYGVAAYSDSRWAAMIDAANEGYEVINMSLGGTNVFGGQGTNELAAYVQAEKRVAAYVTKAGTVMVASAGNDGLDTNGAIIHLPGDIPGIINVSATGVGPSIVEEDLENYEPEYDVLAFYSNYGAAVDIAAPGGDLGPEGTVYPWPAVYHLIFSTYVYLDPVCSANADCPGGYAWMGGTSMAAPHVAGGAGLVLDADPGLNPHQVEAILKQTAEDIGSRQFFGAGLLDVYSAVLRADK